MALFAAGETDKGYEALCACNPLSRCADATLSRAFEGKEYVVPADIYTNEGVYGRCGWSWYTGSAGWYFTAVLKYLLGYREQNGRFTLTPALCCDFPRFTLIINRRGTKYTVTALKTGRKRVVLDGEETRLRSFALDGGEHTLLINEE